MGSVTSVSCFLGMAGWEDRFSSGFVSLCQSMTCFDETCSEMLTARILSSEIHRQAAGKTRVSPCIGEYMLHIGFGEGATGAFEGSTRALLGWGEDGLQEPWRRPARSRAAPRKLTQSQEKSWFTLKKSQIYTEPLYPGHAADASEPNRADPGAGFSLVVETGSLACSCLCASSSNSCWGQAFVMKLNSPASCLLERSFGCLIWKLMHWKLS